MEETNSRFLGEAPVGSLMQRYAIPCIISLLVGALYNIVDQIFIANATYLGSYGEYSGLKRPGYRGSGTIVPQQ